MTREEAISELKAQEEHLIGMSIMGREAYCMAIEALKQPEILTYDEQCIFLAAMGREKKLCEKVDKKMGLLLRPSKYSLAFTCDEIERKVMATLWRREE